MRTLAVSLLCVLPDLALAVPTEIAHQGRLLDEDGVPLDGLHTLAFALYDSPSGGDPVWSESHDLDLAGGYFAVTLGQSSPVDATVLGNEPLWLGLSVDGEELARRPLHSAPYAVRAAVADAVEGAVAVTGPLVVNGVEVISETGTIDFSRIANAPESPLSELSCAEGQILRFGASG